MQEVLHADWQEVWHSPQPPFFMDSFRFLVVKVLICFISKKPPYIFLKLFVVYHKISICKRVFSKKVALLRKLLLTFRWHKDFPLNQFDFSSLIKHIEKESLIPDIIVDTDTGIEFYGADTVSKEILISILKNFNILDNLAQNDSKQQYEKHTHLGVKSFQFEPSWVEITPEKVVVGYVGIYINTDFNLAFVEVNGAYTLIK